MCNGGLASELMSNISKKNAVKRAVLLERENTRLRNGIKSVLSENAHLADGEVCTLRELKRLVPEWEAELLANAEATDAKRSV